MINGIYAVSFRSPRDSGTGTTVFVDGQTYGGDSAYFYKGSINVSGANVSGRIQVKRHSPGESIFGPLENFELDLAGTVTGDKFNLKGNVVGQSNLTINIDGQKVSDL